VHEAGQSTRGWTVSELDAGDLEWHLVDRPLWTVASGRACLADRTSPSSTGTCHTAPARWSARTAAA